MKKKVLVVEDDTLLRDMLRTGLSEADFAVLEAKDGREGLAVAEAEHPSLILLDLLMPEMDGHEVAERLRKTSWGKEIPIIVLSNVDDPKHIAKAVENGIFQYFVKSNTPIDRIVAKVKEFTA